jgi:drug/metabolite transporter (DMT)-like permease
MQNPMSRVDVTRLGALALIWGASFLFIMVAVEGMTDRQVVLFRTWLGAGALLTLVLLRRLPLPRGARLWGHLLVIGGIGNALPFFLFAWAENGRISSGLAGIYNGTTPLFTMMLAMAFLSAEPATLARGIGLMLGFAGVVIVLAPWQSNGGSSLAGQLACLAAGASYGVALVWNRRFLPSFGYPPYSLALGQVAAAGLVTTVLSLFAGWEPLDLTWRVTGSILALGVFGTGIAFFLLYALMDRIGATRASMVTYLIPLVAVGIGVLVLGESVSWHHFVGGAVVLLGIMIAERRLSLLAVRRRPVVADVAG